MPNTDYSQSGRIQQQRNRIVSGFYRANPNARVPDGSPDIYRQVVAGAVPIFTTRIGGAKDVEPPCGCTTTNK